MTYLVMPRLARLATPWLQRPRQQGHAGPLCAGIVRNTRKPAHGVHDAVSYASRKRSASHGSMSLSVVLPIVVGWSVKPWEDSG